MRLRLMIAATALVAGCGDEKSSAPDEIAATSTAVTFDGAGATTPAAKAAHGERLSWVLETIFVIQPIKNIYLELWKQAQKRC